MIRVTVWNEFYHEQHSPEVKEIYPNGIHSAVAESLRSDDITVKTATLYDEPDCGLTQEVLDNTDVLIWWGHCRHYEVPDEVAQRVANAVRMGMGIVFLHSAHHSKPFRLLMGTTCNLSWRESGDMERVWVLKPSHPIAKGIDRYFVVEHDETYAEHFDIPDPDELVFMGWYEGGEVIRSGCCYTRGYGRVFYFQPGHETYPVYYNPAVQTVIRNAVYWANPTCRINELTCYKIEKTNK